MVFELAPTFPVLTPQSPLLLVSRSPEDPVSLAQRAGAATYVATLWNEIEALKSLAQILGPRLLVPEASAQALAQCGVLISSSISGGSFTQRLSEAAAAAPRRCWLNLEWLAMEFSLPCPSGEGRVLEPAALEAVTDRRPTFFDPDLVCRYCHEYRSGKGYMTLYDTAETLGQKAAMAKDAGFQGAVLLQSNAPR